MSTPSFRTYSSPGGQMTYGVQYVLDVGSGQFRPVYSSDLGAQVSVSGLSVSVNAVAITGAPVISLTGNQPVNVTNTAPIAISGVVVSQGGSSNGTVAVTGNPQFQVSNSILPISGVVQTTVSIGNVAVTGGQIQTIVTGTISASTDVSPMVNAQVSGNQYLAAISGSLATSLDTPAWVTGQVSLTSLPTTTFTPTVSILTGSQVTIPVGAKSATVTIVSGSAYINGTGPFPGGYSLNMGGYNGWATLTSSIAVGCTGSAASPCQTIVVWEV